MALVYDNLIEILAGQSISEIKAVCSLPEKSRLCAGKNLWRDLIRVMLARRHITMIPPKSERFPLENVSSRDYIYFQGLDGITFEREIKAMDDLIAEEEEEYQETISGITDSFLTETAKIRYLDEAREKHHQDITDYRLINQVKREFPHLAIEGEVEAWIKGDPLLIWIDTHRKTAIAARTLFGALLQSKYFGEYLVDIIYYWENHTYGRVIQRLEELEEDEDSDEFRGNIRSYPASGYLGNLLLS